MCDPVNHGISTVLVATKTEGNDSLDRVACSQHKSVWTIGTWCITVCISSKKSAKNSPLSLHKFQKFSVDYTLDPVKRGGKGKWRMGGEEGREGGRKEGWGWGDKRGFDPPKNSDIASPIGLFITHSKILWLTSVLSTDNINLPLRKNNDWLPNSNVQSPHKLRFSTGSPAFYGPFQQCSQ